MYKKRYILFLLIAFAHTTSAQQGIVLSQPFVASQFLSPATVGNGVYEHRIQSNLKSQFLDGNNLYRTLVSGWDSRFKNLDPEQKNYFGVGVQLISDQAMAGVINSNYITVGFAYHLFLDANLKNELSLKIVQVFHVALRPLEAIKVNQHQLFVRMQIILILF